MDEKVVLLGSCSLFRKISFCSPLLFSYVLFFTADLKEWKNNTRERIPAECYEEGSPEIRTGVPGSGHISEGP